MSLRNDSKLAVVRDAMAAEDWHKVIRLVARFSDLGEHEQAIRQAKEAIVNPRMYRELGFDTDQLIRAGIEAIKKKYSSSWRSVEKARKSRRDPSRDGEV